jgi:hypothetical protein
MSASRGVLAERMEAEKAQKVVPELRMLGVECIAVPLDETAKFPEAAYLRDGKFTEAGLKCELVTWDGWQLVERSWADVLLASCTQLVMENAQVVALGGLLRRREKIVTSVNRRALLDLFFSEPLLHLRVEETVPQQESERVVPTHPLAYLQNMARQVLRITPPLGVNEGIRLLATEAPPEAFGPVTFSSRRDVEQYNLWLVEILRRDLPIPR